MTNLYLIAQRETSIAERASDILAVAASLTSGVTLLLILAIAF